MDEKLRHVWAQVLDVDASIIQNDSDFFQLGGDSVKSIALAGKANDAGIRLFPQAIFEHSTLTDMAQQASEKQNDTQQESPATGNVKADLMQSWDVISTCIGQCGISNHDLENIYPTAPFQQELMRAAHESGVWQFQAVFEIGLGSFSRAKNAIELIRQRNPALRSRIVQHDDAMYQVVTKSKPEWKTFEGSLAAYKESELQRRFHYGDPLDRLCIVKDNQDMYIVWSKVHAIYDRWSKMEFMVDLQAAFKDPAAFSSAPLRPSFRTFIDFLSNQDREAGIRYWREQLVGLERWDMLWPDRVDFSREREYTTSRSNWQRKLIDFKKPSTRIGLDALAQVAWTITSANLSRSTDIFFMQLRSCRQMSLEGIERIIGPLWTPCPVRRQLTAEQTLQQLLEEVSEKTNKGIPHEPFGLPAALQHFGHRRFLQLAVMVQPPQPDTFSEDIVAKDEHGNQVSMRSAEELWTQARGSFGFYSVLTPKKNDKVELWTRYDEHFIDGQRASEVINRFAETLQRLMSQDWNSAKVQDLCPHLSQAPSAGDKQVNGEHTPSTLTHIFRPDASKSPALIVPSESPLTLTHGDLERLVGQMQSAFAKLGVGRGSAVSIALPNSMELIVTFLAATWQRGIAAPLNPAYKQDEFEFYIDDLGSAVVVIPKGGYEKGDAVVKAAKKYDAAIAECYWDGKEVVLDVKESGKLAKAKAEGKLEADEDDVALVLHTSGTTGRPKAVPLTHANLLTSIGNICHTYKLTSADRTMLIMPLFHVHGLLASFMSPLYSGGSAIVPQSLKPDFWQVFEKHQATWVSATPSMHRVILEFTPPSAEALKRIRFIRSCSSQLSPAMFDKLEKTFGVPVLESYAMTEASHLMCSNPLPPAKRFAGSVGQAQGIDLAILDEAGNAVAQGNEGEVCVRGQNVTKGYLNNPEANKSSFTADGFFRTGDQGKVDKEGYLTLTGRLKEMINKGGEKISPAELDNLISQHESIAESVAFAIDDEAYGQDVGVAVKLADGKSLDAQELKTWVSGKVSKFKVPKNVWFPEEIPKTATGKVQRRLVAEAMAKSS